MTRVAFNHHREGSGEPLVLIHGVGHHWQGWRPVIALLTDTFDVIAVDTPGFGRSSELPAGVAPTIQAHAEAFAAWFDELGLDRPHVAGNSMGGAIALELARRGAVSSATAISPAGFWTPGERRYGQFLLGSLTHMPAPVKRGMLRAAGSAGGRTALGNTLFARPWRMPAEEFRAMLTDSWASPAMTATLKAFDDHDFGAGHELDGTPVTVAWGSRDMLLPYGRQAPRARAALPCATHVTLDGLGHTPFYDDPGVVAHVVRVGAGAS